MAKIEVLPGQTPAEASGYEYIPSQTIAIVFLVLFTLSALVHIAQGIRGKYWIVFPTLVTGALGMFKQHLWYSADM
jgi:succinate dehydrogenase/fumarate reductase cytochrome b subunit